MVKRHLSLDGRRRERALLEHGRRRRRRGRRRARAGRRGGARTDDTTDEAADRTAARGDADTFSATASLRRSALERDLRATARRLHEIDARLSTLARARGQHAQGSAATGGVAAPTAAPEGIDLRSEEERTLATEREQLAQHADQVRNDAAKLREEVTARFGATPPWWIDLR